MLPRSLVLLSLLATIACGGKVDSDAGPSSLPDAGSRADAGYYDGGSPRPLDAGPQACIPASGPCSDEPCLRINEALSDNEGLWLDETLETEDYVELVNAGSEALEASQFFLADDSAPAHRLPAALLEPGEGLLVWLDDEQEEGAAHMPFKLSSQGDGLLLYHLEGALVDCWQVPALAENQVMARFPDGLGAPEICAFASPDAPNPDRCEPQAPPPAVPSYDYVDFALSEPWPRASEGLALNELALRQAQPFVELWSGYSQSLEGLSLSVAVHAPGLPWPQAGEGEIIALSGGITAGNFQRIDLPSQLLVGLEADPSYEGVVTLFAADGSVLDRVDFMHWPEGASLARAADGAGTWRLCQEPSPAASNGDCAILLQREVGERLRRLLTPGDHSALSQGGRALGMEAVKMVIDRDAGGVVHLLSAAAWELHYNFVRERIDGDPHLDRCIPEEREAFRAGWGEFSRRHYVEVEGRRYLLATLIRYASNGAHTLEFTTGDRISPPLIAEAYWGLMPSLLEPARWALRPQGPGQHEKALALEGELPIVAENTPFLDLVEQPLNAAVGYGLLRFVPFAELDQALLGQQVVLITDQVPNELPFVGGLITEAFQTPLAHVNLLARNRDSPNLALRTARQDPRVAPFLDRLVRFEVTASGFNLRAAAAEEAEAFWAQRRAEQEVLQPRQDLSLRGVQDLSDHDLGALPALGAKAAQLAQLRRIQISRGSCPGFVSTPVDAFALPLVHSVEHLQASGAQAQLEALLEDPDFRSNPERRAQGLAALRQLILEHPVDAALLSEFTEAIRTRYGLARVRLRSSSNTEDLPGFNGAGLYQSVSAAVGDSRRSVADGLRQVWASLWTPRAYDERAWFQVDQSRVAMGVLVHAAFRSEKANGVGISRNVLDPNRGDIYFLTVQAGEASVTNPAPGVGAESFLYRFGRSPAVVHQSRSTLTGGQSVMTSAEIRKAVCTLAGIHSAFQPLIDPDGENRYFAMDIEFKLIGNQRQLLVKQARPFSFGSLEPVGDCREF